MHRVSCSPWRWRLVLVYFISRGKKYQEKKNARLVQHCLWSTFKIFPLLFWQRLMYFLLLSFFFLCYFNASIRPNCSLLLLLTVATARTVYIGISYHSGNLEQIRSRPLRPIKSLCLTSVHSQTQEQCFIEWIFSTKLNCASNIFFFKLSFC